MKKLESLAHEKFTLSESEQSRITGGMAQSDSYTYTFTEYDTQQAGGGATCDKKWTDSCVDW